MNPSLIISIAAASGLVGSLLFSYHVGRTQERTICEAEFYRAKLEQKIKELDQEKSLTELQKQQISEAYTKLDEEADRNAALKENLDKAVSSKSAGCITDGMLDAIKKYRATTHDKNP